MKYVVVEKIGKARCVMRHVKGKVQIQRRNPGKKVRVKGKEEGVPATFIREVSIHMAAKTRQRSASRDLKVNANGGLEKHVANAKHSAFRKPGHWRWRHSNAPPITFGRTMLTSGCGHDWHRAAVKSSLRRASEHMNDLPLEWREPQNTYQRELHVAFSTLFLFGGQVEILPTEN
ncbi:hypothetical protein MRX96_016007 [Rhipicephalus microplus]